MNPVIEQLYHAVSEQVLAQDPLMLKVAAGVFVGGLGVAVVRWAVGIVFWLIWAFFAVLGAIAS